MALRLVKLDAPTRAAYTVKCPWCSAVSLSVWWPGHGKTVIATCMVELAVERVPVPPTRPGQGDITVRVTARDEREAQAFLDAP